MDMSLRTQTNELKLPIKTIEFNQRCQSLAIPKSNIRLNVAQICLTLHVE